MGELGRARRHLHPAAVRHALDLVQDQRGAIVHRIEEVLEGAQVGGLVVRLDACTNTSRVFPDTPPSTWQATHFACTMGPEMWARNTSPALSVSPGTPERLVRCPVGLESRLSTRSGCAELTTRRHLPVPVPSAPLRPRALPLSSSRALSVREAPAGKREGHRAAR